MKSGALEGGGRGGGEGGGRKAVERRNNKKKWEWAEERANEIRERCEESDYLKNLSKKNKDKKKKEEKKIKRKTHFFSPYSFCKKN
jgi:hypothetical protein